MPKEKGIPYPYRCPNKEKYMYVSRRAFFNQESINETLNKMIFQRDWQERNEELRAKQKKMGVTDAEIVSRRKKRLRRWRLKKKT